MIKNNYLEAIQRYHQTIVSEFFKGQVLLVLFQGERNERK